MIWLGDATRQKGEVKNQDFSPMICGFSLSCLLSRWLIRSCAWRGQLLLIWLFTRVFSLLIAALPLSDFLQPFHAPLIRIVFS